MSTVATTEGHVTLDERTIAEVVRFHGHMCPGLAMGLQASQIALREIGPNATDEQVVAVVETDMCAVDAIQFQTGCTFGKGNLIHRDWGKNAFTFFRRSDGKGIRVSLRPNAWQQEPEHRELFAKRRAGETTAAEDERFLELHVAAARRVLEMAPEDLYDVAFVDAVLPPKARIHASVRCESCGEGTMETRIRRVGGRELCPPCFDAALAGP